MNEQMKDLAQGIAARCGWAEAKKDVTMLDVCRAALAAEGRDVPTDRPMLARAAVSTASTGFAETMVAAGRQGLAKVYGSAPDWTRGLVGEADLKTYRPETRVVLFGENLDLLVEGAAGVCNPAAIREINQVFKFAKQLVMDDQDIAGDDVGIFRAFIEAMGRAALGLRPDLVCATLLANAPLETDGVALFHGDHSNLGSAVLSKTSLAAAMAAMRLQKDPAGNPLNLAPKALLVPPSLEGTARESIRALEIAGEPSPALVVEARLEHGQRDPRTGTELAGSTTAWFVLGDPAQAATIELCFLAGSDRQPGVSQWVCDKGTWGVGFAAYLEIGATALDYRGCWKSTGLGS